MKSQRTDFVKSISNSDAIDTTVTKFSDLLNTIGKKAGIKG